MGQQNGKLIDIEFGTLSEEKKKEKLNENEMLKPLNVVCKLTHQWRNGFSKRTHMNNNLKFKLHDKCDESIQLVWKAAGKGSPNPEVAGSNPASHQFVLVQLKIKLKLI